MSWDPTGREGSASNRDGPSDRSVRESMHQRQNMRQYDAYKLVLGTLPVTPPNRQGGAGAGAGNPSVSTAGAAAVVTAGPGNAGVKTDVAQSGVSSGTGPGNSGPVVGPETTPVFAGGSELPRDKGWSDGQDYEDRWGEWGGGLAGLGVMIADGWQGAKGSFDTFYEAGRGGPLADIQRDGDGAWDALSRVTSDLFQTATSRREGLDGTNYRTGGGF